MKTAAKAYDLLHEMANKGNPASISDVGVGILATLTCVEGAGMNVRINLKSLKDEKLKSSLGQEVQKIRANSDHRAGEILRIVEGKLG
jgi:formiminotetrahydrofolate cyclodeaminase